LLDGYVRFVEERAPVTQPYPVDARERMVHELSCPRGLVDALVASLGVDGARAFLTVSNEPGPRTLRANTLRCTRDELAARLRAEDGVTTRAGTLTPWSLHVEGRANLFGSAAWRDGWFEVQDEGSQCVAVACATPGGSLAGATVVDLCAGRGGKTLALAAMMRNEGALYVHDVDARALADMQPRLARAGVTCVRAGLPPEDARVDVVLVDAPCSSTGVLRRSPDLRFTFDARAVAELVRTQHALAAQARTIAGDARVVYATCSVLREENAAVADAHGLRAQRTWVPHVDGCDGFFVAG
jgi:16S rRNA (cytosine967-C5)-methyltransferase